MSEPGWTIRKARPEDLAYLGAIEAAGDAQFPPGRFPGEPGSDNVPVAELERGRSCGLLWVAIAEDSRPCAFQYVREEGMHLHLRQIVVHPDHQRRGIGRALIAELEAEARRRGIAILTLTTFADIAWNAPVYRRLGFRVLSGEELASPESMYLSAELAAELAAGMVERVAMMKTL